MRFEGSIIEKGYTKGFFHYGRTNTELQWDYHL